MYLRIVGIEKRIPDSAVVNKKAKTCRRMGFFVSSISQESEKSEKYQDLVKKLKKLWNIKLAVIPITVGVLRTYFLSFWSYTLCVSDDVGIIQLVRTCITLLR